MQKITFESDIEAVPDNIEALFLLNKGQFYKEVPQLAQFQQRLGQESFRPEFCSDVLDRFASLKVLVCYNVSIRDQLQLPTLEHLILINAQNLDAHLFSLLSESIKSIVAINTTLHIPRAFYKSAQIISNCNKLSCTHDAIEEHFKAVLPQKEAAETFEQYCSIMGIAVMEDLPASQQEACQQLAKTNGFRLAQNLKKMTAQFDVSEDELLKEMFSSCSTNDQVKQFMDQLQKSLGEKLNLAEKYPNVLSFIQQLRKDASNGEQFLKDVLESCVAQQTKTQFVQDLLQRDDEDALEPSKVLEALATCKISAEERQAVFSALEDTQQQQGRIAKKAPRRSYGEQEPEDEQEKKTKQQQNLIYQQELLLQLFDQKFENLEKFMLQDNVFGLSQDQKVALLFKSLSTEAFMANFDQIQSKLSLKFEDLVKAEGASKLKIELGKAKFGLTLLEQLKTVLQLEIDEEIQDKVLANLQFQLQGEINEQIQRIEGLIDEENKEMKGILAGMVEGMVYASAAMQ